MTSDKASEDSDVAPSSALPIDIVAAAAPPSKRFRRSSSEADVPLVRNKTSTKRQSKPRIKRSGHARNGNARVIDVVSKTNDGSLQPSSSGDAFFREVSVLDEEIKQLGSLLAQKLHLQNTQIKKMLKRFDIS
ncbi:hypothetical protein [Ensifer aridi]|uniref:hypothetical protein n=1 Tax=Ensifer aridi TaxID=1708715 RepID=UPI00041F8712|nr:hypothetical protein [Ensifer aridi]